MQDEIQEPVIFPSLSDRDRKWCGLAIRQLQSRGVIANFNGTDDLDEAELYAWAARNLPLIEAYFQFAGLGVRAQSDFPVIQLVLEDETQAHPLRRRLDKVSTGLLICLWVLYHERVREVDGFFVAVKVEEVYARLAALYRTDAVVSDAMFKDTIALFQRFYLVQADWLPGEFLQSQLGLLPTLLTTFRFQDAAEAQRWVTPSGENNPPVNYP